MKRVKVDFSTTVRGGMVRANQGRATSPLVQGDRVEAFDPEENLHYMGTVAQVDADGKFAYLCMDWEPRVPRPVGRVNVAGANLVFNLRGGVAQAASQTAREVSSAAPTITAVSTVYAHST
ncbi:hypothetical protein A3N97_03695 [Mycobacteroides abscessus]|uniref:hypothetical protein n=1 Tax=Mycobacteroides abscessus TaxID=36809 RepID=UPI00078CFC8E|nr:hypothetical protein [Mycobacteroides abscessus]AMU29793.1 hypothetical protein A3N97_03695 [Mycobacteroides abscessus]SKV58901.1 Uncharacterised protein [Mycobacteroides abscessus subsp. massiliense]